MLDGLITIIGGILAASALIIARKPNAKDLIDKLTPYQGWIGVVLFVWGVWDTLTIVRFLGDLAHRPVLLLFGVAVTITNLVVGFLLGFGLITKYTLSGNANALARGQALRAKLARYQGAFGLCAIALGATYIVLVI